MERLSGRLLDGDRVVFGRVFGSLETEGGGGSPAATGRFEVHEGGILSGHLAIDRPYILDLEDGRSGGVYLTHVHSSNSSGIAFLEFRLAGPMTADVARRLAAPVEATA